MKRKFSVGIELPQDDGTAFRIYVPAFDLPGYSCCSASDEQSLIPDIAADAILSIAQMMVTDGHDVLNIEDAGIELYSLNQDYAHCERWLTVIVDL
ncbi:TPA: antitoxin HicB [Escherichia coli]